jgi:hypothetical protein
MRGRITENMYKQFQGILLQKGPRNEDTGGRKNGIKRSSGLFF